MSGVKARLSMSQLDQNYKGSRRVKARFAYSDESLAGFIEMSGAYSYKAPEVVIQRFRESLEAVSGVVKVALHPKGSKTTQGNAGNHYQEHNFMVHSEKLPNTGIEMEISRHTHWEQGTYTVTALFKQPRLELVPEAWRILRAACAGQELLPHWAAQQEEDAMARWRARLGEQEPDFSDPGQPGSSSGPAAAGPADSDVKANADVPSVLWAASGSFDVNKGDLDPAFYDASQPAVEANVAGLAAAFEATPADERRSNLCPTFSDPSWANAQEEELDQPGSGSGAAAADELPSWASSRGTLQDQLGHNSASEEEPVFSDLDQPGSGSEPAAADELVPADSVLSGMPPGFPSKPPGMPPMPTYSEANARAIRNHIVGQPVVAPEPGPAEPDADLDSVVRPASGSLDAWDVCDPASDVPESEAWDWQVVEAMSMLDEEPAAGDGIDWGGGDEATEFQANAVPDVVLRPASGSPEERLGLDELVTKLEMFPEYIGPAVLARLAASPEMKAMQAMKSREIEHCRWRSSDVPIREEKLKAVIHSMTTELRAFVQQPEDGRQMPITKLCELAECTVPSDITKTSSDFVNSVHRLALKITDLKKEGYQSMREEYVHLFSSFPRSTVSKVGQDQLQTVIGQALALAQLVSKHSGEIVEADARGSSWRLLPGPPVPAIGKWTEQFWCLPDGKLPDPRLAQRKREAQLREWGPGPLPVQHAMLIGAEIQIVTRSCYLLTEAMLKPCWDRQQFRVVCPCAGTDMYHWARTGLVVSLGQLFLILGKRYTSAQIYHFYRTLRIVAVKRTKGGSRRQDASGQALPATGSLAVGTAGTAVRRGMMQWREQLVEEFCTLTGRDIPEDNVSRATVFDKAVQYVHVNLLQDLSPPWIGSEFLRALPGDGVLSQYLKPTFLAYDLKDACYVFGDTVMRTLCKVAQAVNLTVAGILAKPLYACARLKEGRPCMMLAAMSPLMERKSPHKHFLCPECVRDGGAAPASDGPPSRLMRLYLRARTEGDKTTVMRSVPLYIMVSMPPTDVAWGIGEAQPTEPGPPPQPARVKTDRVMYQYSAQESLQIWIRASSYHEKESR
jgi:hypothetical protein